MGKAPGSTGMAIRGSIVGADARGMWTEHAPPLGGPVSRNCRGIGTVLNFNSASRVLRLIRSNTSERGMPSAKINGQAQANKIASRIPRSLVDQYLDFKGNKRKFLPVEFIATRSPSGKPGKAGENSMPSVESAGPRRMNNGRSAAPRLA